MNTPDLSAARWRKSSRSGSTGGQCVEVAGLSAAQWVKSSRSTDTGGECVEVAGLARVVAVRDSKNPDGAKLIFNAADWHAFTRRVKHSEHDLA